MKHNEGIILKKATLNNINALQFFQLLRYGTFILIGVLLSKSQLGTVNIGHYETFLLLASAFSFFWVNGYLKAMMPETSKKSGEDLKIFVFNTFLLLFVLSLVFALLVYWVHDPFSNLLLNGNPVHLPLALSGYILFNSPALMIEYVYLIHHKPKHMVAYGLISFFLQAVMVGIPPFLGYGLHEILILLFLFSLLKFGWLLVVLRKYATAVFRLNEMKELFLTGLPLVLSILLSSSARYIDGFIVTSRFSPEEFAIFQYGARELPLALLMANSLGMAMLPRFSGSSVESPLAELRSEVSRLNWFLFPVSALLMLTSHWFFPIVFNPQFAASATLFNIYLLLVISRVLFPQTLLIAQRINRTIVRASFFEIVLNVGFSILLARWIGLRGVAYATLIAYLFEKIYLAIALKRKLGINPGQYIPLKTYFLSSLLLIAVFIFVEFFIF
ncbi:MAG TPA: oligosaccharide flippase family protein [Prolixibacteraceae bacterium]|nr:oligosaccharide flippase family protein [Prolixibacteraceae bacterium]